MGWNRSTPYNQTEVNVKSPVTLWQMVALDFATWCNARATRDVKTVSDRYKHEGLSFLTITLPDFGKGLEKALDLGRVDPDLFPSFRSRGKSPLFLSGFLDLVFDRDSGLLLDDPSVEAIRAIRQLTLMFGKMNLPCSEERVSSAFDKFIECEKELRVSDRWFGSHAKHPDTGVILKPAFQRIGHMLFERLFTEIDRKVVLGDLMPKHGPGATAEKLSSNGKYRQREWTNRLESVFPSWEYLLPSERFYESLADIEFLEPGQERPVRVISVPKTLKTPRIIAIEPACMQYVQQGLMEAIRETVEKSFLDEFIGTRSQIPNQDLALLGSLTGDLATLDLSEASDRVSNQHVRALLSRWPHLDSAVDACRSRKADVPGHGVVRLAKFASMGSALTFPMEAMVFLTIVLVGIEQGLNRSLTMKDINHLRGRVRIYGDDIIVPVRFIRPVIANLEAYGYKVNANKSFWTGKFRESCGKEYYNGSDVSIVRVRSELPTDRQHVKQLVSTSATRNLFYEAGLWKAARYLDSEMERIIRFYPNVAKTADVLGRFSFLGYAEERTDPYLHVPLVKGYRVRSQFRPDSLDGSGALLKFFLKRGMEPTEDEKHLERAGRPSHVALKRGWYRPF